MFEKKFKVSFRIVKIVLNPSVDNNISMILIHNTNSILTPDPVKPAHAVFSLLTPICPVCTCVLAVCCP